MSLKFMSLPMYIIICVLISGFLVLTVVKRYNLDRKALIGVYFTVAILPLLAAIGRTIEEIYQQYSKFVDYISIAMISLVALVVIELIYLALTHKGSDKSKKLIIVGFIVMLISIIPVMVLLIVD